MTDVNQTPNEEVMSAWAEVLSDKGEVNWMCSNLSKDGSLSLVGKGTQGLKELQPVLDEGQVQFAGLRVRGVDDRGTTCSVRTKFILCVLVGSSVPVMRRAKVSVQKEQVLPFFKGYSIDYTGDCPDDFTIDDLCKKLLASGGAHKPQYYEFGAAGDESQRIELNFYSKDETKGHKVVSGGR